MNKCERCLKRLRFFSDIHEYFGHIFCYECFILEFEKDKNERK